MGVQKAKNTESTLKVANASMNYPHAFSAAFTVFFFSKRPSVTVQTGQAHCLSWSPSFSQMETEAGTFTQLQNVEVGKNKTKDNFSITRQIFQRKKKVDATISHGHYKKTRKENCTKFSSSSKEGSEFAIRPILTTGFLDNGSGRIE